MEGITRKFTAEYKPIGFKATFDAMDREDAVLKMTFLVRSLLAATGGKALSDDEIYTKTIFKMKRYDKAILLGTQVINVRGGKTTYIPRMSVVDLKVGIDTGFSDEIVMQRAYNILSVDQVCASRKAILLCSETNELFVLKNQDGMEMHRIKNGDAWWRITTIDGGNK